MEMLRARGSPNVVVQVPNLSAMQRFFITSNHLCHRDYETREEEEEEEDKDIELTLGLSLNGQFGTDPRSRKRKSFELGRSSSIPEVLIFDEQRSGGVYGGDMWWTVGRGVSDMFQLDRTRSLPAKSEMEAETETEIKRKRSEKTRAFIDFGVPSLTKEKNRAKVETDKASAFLSFNLPPPTKEKVEKDRVVVSGLVNGSGKKGNTTKKKNQEVYGMERAKNILEDMPCVSTRDVGPDGKRVEGFLYRYGGNKEEVKIVCVCHGSFLSPAEFVKHGGGTISAVSDDGGDDIKINPLRHIVVKLPSSSL